MAIMYFFEIALFVDLALESRDDWFKVVVCVCKILIAVWIIFVAIPGWICDSNSSHKTKRFVCALKLNIL